MASPALDTLLRLNYDVNSQLQLRHIHTGRPFKFIDQNHYEELADAVADYVQEVMVKDYGMMKVDLPFPEHLSSHNEKAQEDDEEGIVACIQCPIFVSSNLKEAETVLILLCGTGRVASGQWARRLCINDSLKTGSVLPFLDWAKEHSFGVVVLNPNKNVVETLEGLCRIPYNETSEAHVEYVWEAICKGLPAKHFVLVAHSYGGISACKLLENHGREVLERLRCIAFTDSVHSEFSVKNLSEEAELFLSKCCINWAASQESLDTVLQMPGGKFASESGEESEQIEGFDSVYNISNIVREARTADCNTENKDEHSDHSPIACTQDDNNCAVSSAGNKGEHAEQSDFDDDPGCSSVDYSQNAQKEGTDGCWLSELKDLPALAEPATKYRKRSNRRRSKISDWFGARSSTCKVVSSGTDVHEQTTMSAYSSICRFLLESLQSAGAVIEVH